MRVRSVIRLFGFISMSLLFFFAALSAQAQTTNQENPSIPFEGAFAQSYSPNDRPLKVAEPIDIIFTFKHSIDEEVLPPEELPSERWHLISTDTQIRPLNDTQKETILTMQVSVNRPGATTLPPLTFTILDRSGKSSQVQGKPIHAKLISILPDELNLSFKAPRPPVEIWVEDYTLAWFGGFGVLALMFLGLYFFMKSRKEIIIIPQPPRAAHDIALEKLGEVAGFDNVDDANENMAFYVRVSEAIREYMGTIWSFPGTELTTTEILKHLRQKTFPLGLSQDDIGQFLNETDYVKFAGSQPDGESNARILRRAFSIIELTKSLSNSRHTDALTQFRERHGTLDASEGQDGSLGPNTPVVVDEKKLATHPTDSSESPDPHPTDSSDSSDSDQALMSRDEKERIPARDEGEKNDL